MHSLHKASPSTSVSKIYLILTLYGDLLSLQTSAELRVHHLLTRFSYSYHHYYGYSVDPWIQISVVQTWYVAEAYKSKVGGRHKLPVLEVFSLYFLHIEKSDQIIMPRSGSYPLSRRLVLFKASLSWTGWHREVTSINTRKYGGGGCCLAILKQWHQFANTTEAPTNWKRKGSIWRRKGYLYHSA